MAKKIMTLDNLYKFFVEQNKSFNFSSKESGQPIVVTTNGNFAEEQNDDMPGMLKLKLKNCHIDTNRNGSHISKENMEKAMPTLKYRPILAYIHELPDGTKDFYAHNIQIEEDENDEEFTVETVPFPKYSTLLKLYQFKQIQLILENFMGELHQMKKKSNNNINKPIYIQNDYADIRNLLFSLLSIFLTKIISSFVFSI